METKVNDSAFLPIGILLSLQYKIIGHIGAGGFGKTYLIEDQLGNKKVMKEFFISSMCTRNSSTNSVTVSVDENRGTFKGQLLSKLKSKVLSEIDAIEEISSYAGGRVLRIRNSAKKIGLCKCWKLFVKKILPIEYDAIYPCDVNVFICEQKGKKGVYNVELKKMMIPVEHDEIHITSENKLEVYKNGVVTKYTTKGFRLIS